MSWVRLDDRYPGSPKIHALSDGAFRLWHQALAWANAWGTDGLIRVSDLATVHSGTRDRRRCELAAELERVGLWHLSGQSCDHEKCPAAETLVPPDSWVIHDFWEYSPPAEVVSQTRKARAEAGRLGGLRSAATRRAKANTSAIASLRNEANAEPNAEADRCEANEPRPVPGKRDTRNSSLSSTSSVPAAQPSASPSAERQATANAVLACWCELRQLQTASTADRAEAMFLATLGLPPDELVVALRHLWLRAITPDDPDDLPRPGPRSLRYFHQPLQEAAHKLLKGTSNGSQHASADPARISELLTSLSLPQEVEA